MVNFVNGSELEAVPAADRARLAEMTPATYTGNAAEQAKQLKELIEKISLKNKKAELWLRFFIMMTLTHIFKLKVF